MNKTINPLLSTISNDLIKCDINKYTKYFENGMEYDDYKDLVNFNNDLVSEFV